jgi:hypothetical protein
MFSGIGNFAASSKRTGNQGKGKAMKNDGTADRVIRVVIGIALLSLLFLLHVHGLKYWIGWLGLIGLVPLVTGLVGVCQMYTLLGIRTRPVSQLGK